MVALVAANLIPLAGVVFLDWAVYDVMLVYWLENGVIGLFTLLRMATAGREALATIALGPFFVLHYGLFWVVHGTFVVALFAPEARYAVGGSPGAVSLPSSLPILGEVPWVPAAGWAVLGLVVSHAISFVQNWWIGGERHGATPKALMFGAYGRVVVLHLTLIGGGFAVQMLGAPLLALLGLVILKIGLDVGAHLREHASAAQRAAHAGAASG